LTVYLVRHCQSSGQQPEAPLTPLGQQQAVKLADALEGLAIRRIVSSPYVRARQSAAPLAVRLGLAVETDQRLIERVLSPDDLPDWRDHVRASFDDLDLCLPGGESGRQATQRAVAALADVWGDPRRPAVVVAHGGLISLLLHHIDARPGFEAWSQLTNPDVFRIESVSGDEGDGVGWSAERLWQG
jgi:2,3-bisphosphoglycerate-dependent phosphoglycerate mutase